MGIDMTRWLLQDFMFSCMFTLGSAMGCCYVVDSEGVVSALSEQATREYVMCISMLRSTRSKTR